MRKEFGSEFGQGMGEWEPMNCWGSASGHVMTWGSGVSFCFYYSVESVLCSRIFHSGPAARPPAPRAKPEPNSSPTKERKKKEKKGNNRNEENSIT